LRVASSGFDFKQLKSSKSLPINAWRNILLFGYSPATPGISAIAGLLDWLALHI
jgi:hypothetical protein